MPWFPEFSSALELARRSRRDLGAQDPVARLAEALNSGDRHALEAAWPGEIVIEDPREGRVAGTRQVREFIRHSSAWLADHQARSQVVASTSGEGRAVVELLAHLDVADQSTEPGTEGDARQAGEGGPGTGTRELQWPVAVVAESPASDAVIFRIYYSQWPLTGRHHLRPALLPDTGVEPADVVGRYHRALGAGDVPAILAAYAPEGSFREPSGPQYIHRGTAELTEFYTGFFSAGGGIHLQHATVTDDGTRCALEYTCDRWGDHDLPPQAGIGVYERGPDGLLVSARVYDDVQAPVE